MLLGVGNGEYGGIELANLHAVQIAQGIINGGYTLIVAGSVREAADQICRYLSGNREMKAAFDRGKIGVGAAYQPQAVPSVNDVVTEYASSSPDIAELEKRLSEARQKVRATT